MTCGAFGAGKTYLTVKDAVAAYKSGIYKNIYSNVRGHAELCDYIQPLPDDWRECEHYSLIIIDEVQTHEKFSKHFSSRRDAEIVDVTMVRHNHCDIWMTSPSPTLLNSDIRNLVNQYIYCEASGSKTSKAYCFTKVQNSITKSVKVQAYDEYTYSIEEKYYKLYTSTKDGNSSGRAYHRNIKLMGFIGGMAIIVAIIAGLSWYLMKGTKEDAKKFTTAVEKNAPKKEADPVKDVTNQVKLSDVDCRKGVNVDKPECKEYFNRLTKNGESVGSTTQQVSYDPSKPFESADKIQETVTYQVTAKPVLSGCMTDRHGKLVGYTQQGTIVHDLNPSDCKRILKGDRPFDYFKAQPLSTGIVKDVPQEQIQPKQQPIQYANNYVQSGLDHKFDGANDRSNFSF
ncbi:zonular occludens toxin domain-containing protein [Acinetobacter nosocomialis]|uniref:zonular occludens toxin domain-containing protein n=1 Tax=Acinetobacter nosocomialis TaxID=106654 RepID=UPI00148F3F94|nr:zonular occludens toxin domain-containing protein [Acinetobacter nosocomialis]